MRFLERHRHRQCRSGRVGPRDLDTGGLTAEHGRECERAAAGTGSDSGTTTTAVTARAMNGLGNVVTDNNGMTLYRFDKDEPSPSKWTCKGACTMTWIPVIVRDSVQTSGVEKSLLGTVHRSGLKQLTLAGWPLYRYIGDTAAGQVNGQGKDGEWYAIAPSGQKSATTG